MIGRLIRILFLSGLLLGLDRLLSDSVLNKEKSHRDTNRRDNHPRLEDSNRTILKKTPRSATASAQSADKHDEGTSEIEKAIAKWTKRLAIFTGALAFFTLVAAGASIYQSIILSGQLGEMQNASSDMKSSIEATNRLADASVRSNIEAHRLADEAKRSADNAINTAERQLRAYLDIVDDDIMKCPACDTIDIDKPINITREHIYDNTITINIKNTGETPAYHIHIDDSYWWGNFGEHIPKGFTYPIIPTNQKFAMEGSTGTLGRGEKAPGFLIIDVSIIPMIVKARRHIVSLFHYGNIYYEDVFGIHRETPFCVEYIPDYPDNPFANCPEHNTPEQGK